MPDLQTEMQKILQSWDQPETTQQPETTENTMFKPTTNTTRATFELVRDNPYKTKREYIKLLEQKGFKASSTASLISQMTRQGLLSVDDMGLMHSNQTEYSPLKTAKTYAKQAKKPKTSKLRTSREPSKEALAAAAEAMGSIGINGLIERPYRTKLETILDDISLSDAHALYRELHRYFGGLPK
jgi:hypothetical protein